MSGSKEMENQAQAIIGIIAQMVQEYLLTGKLLNNVTIIKDIKDIKDIHKLLQREDDIYSDNWLTGGLLGTKKFVPSLAIT